MLQEVHYMPQTHEMRLENLNSSKTIDLSHTAANFVQKHQPPAQAFRGNQFGF